MNDSVCTLINARPRSRLRSIVVHAMYRRNETKLKKKKKKRNKEGKGKDSSVVPAFHFPFPVNFLLFTRARRAERAEVLIAR